MSLSHLLLLKLIKQLKTSITESHPLKGLPGLFRYSGLGKVFVGALAGASFLPSFSHFSASLASGLLG